MCPGMTPSCRMKKEVGRDGNRKSLEMPSLAKELWGVGVKVESVSQFPLMP